MKHGQVSFGIFSASDPSVFKQSFTRLGSEVECVLILFWIGAVVTGKCFRRRKDEEAAWRNREMLNEWKSREKKGDNIIK